MERAKKMNAIVKRRGHTESYDNKKVYASCYFACRSSHMKEIPAEKIAAKVTNSVSREVLKKGVLTSDEIFKLVAKELRKHDEDSAFMYETHRDIS